MAKRIIECSVKDEYILGSGVPVGAAGSHDDVILRIAFNEMWEGLNIYAVFCNALGANPESIALTPEMLFPGEAMTYDLPIPASAKAIEGRMPLTLAGYSVVDGADEDIATNTMQAFFRVLPSGYRVFNDNSISATIAQQLLNSINELHKKKVSLEELTAAVENAIRIAQESGEFDGADGKSAYEYAVEGGFEGSEEDFYEKLAKGGTGDFSGRYEDLEGKPTIPTKISQLLNDKEFVTQQSAEQYSNNAVNTHNASGTSHNDIRLLIEGLTARLNTFLNSDDVTLDEAKELVAYIKANRSLIEEVTSKKINYTDIIDNLTTNNANKPLSAAQGVKLKALIDSIEPSGGITNEIDPTVPNWAKQPTKPTYSKSEVGLGNVDNVKQYSAENEPPYPVTSVNGKKGAVSLSASDVGARPSSWTPTYSEVGADKSGTADSAVSTHNANTESHNDIRLLISGLSGRVNALLNSDDTTLDETKEIVAYIKNNKTLIDSITTSKVSVSDIINNLTTNVTNKPLSAAQGVVIKALIDAKLDSSKLAEAINTALAEAKASGEFDGEDGKAGERGTGILPTTTGIASYTTTTNGVTPAYRILISTLKTQSKVSEVLVGDQVRYSYYLYPVIYVDADYAYLGTRVSIRGATGSAGTSVTVSSVSESTESGGSNVVNFSDGKTLTVKNGKDGTGEEIPDYVIEESEATISKLFSHGNLGRTIRFIAISDTHEDSAESYNPQITISNKHAGQAIKYIADRIGLDFVAHLGDASSCGAFTTAYEFDVLCNDIKNINKFVFSGIRGIKNAFIPGNHDMISMNGVSLLNSGAYTLFGNMCSGNKDRVGGWGYFDIDDAKVRVIYLNTSDSPSSAAYLALTQTQKNWLCETLIDVNTKDDAGEWKIILLSHAPLDFGGANISTDILIPYVNGETYDSYSFNGKNSAKIISNIHGHVHCFSYGYIADKIRRFTIPNACFVGANHYSSRTEYADWTDTVTYNKTANSGKDTSFSLVTIDLDSGECYVDNYGAGIDRVFSTDYNSTEVVVPRNEIEYSLDTDETTVYNGIGYALNTRLGSDGTTRANATDCVTSGLIPYDGQSVELVIPTTSPGSYAYFHIYVRYNNVPHAKVPFELPDGTQVDGSGRQISFWVSDWGVSKSTVGSTTVLTIPASIIAQAGNGAEIIYLRVSSNIDSGVTVDDSTFRLSFID